MVSWKTLARWNTGYSADSVEWCPLAPFRDVLVCGTYQLDKSDEEKVKNTKQTRLGRIYLFKIEENAKELCPIQTIDTSGILDQKWCYHLIQGYPVLAAVTSDGAVHLYKLQEADGQLKLVLWHQTTIGENVLALSIDWSTNKTSSVEPMLVVSDSAGFVKVLKITESCFEEIYCRHAHGYEAWIGSFNYWNADVFYSGGDDCLFKGYDMRVPDLVLTNKTHEAGVTAIRCDVDRENVLLTGSYDEKIRTWDVRSLKRCVFETEVGGGLWRLKWHPKNKRLVLAACMYGGFRILREVASSGGKLDVVTEYLEHKSIAYGADWNKDGELVATCSFYDCKMHLGEVTFE